MELKLMEVYKNINKHGKLGSGIIDAEEIYLI